MNRQDKIRLGRHYVFKIPAHLVFVTKYRRHVFTKNMIDDLKPIFEKVGLGLDPQLIEFNGKDDHIHLLGNYPPKIALSSLVNSLKGVVSRMIRKNIILKLKVNYGAFLYGLHPTLSPVVMAHLLLDTI